MSNDGDESTVHKRLALALKPANTKFCGFVLRDLNAHVTSTRKERTTTARVARRGRKATQDEAPATKQVAVVTTNGDAMRGIIFDALTELGMPAHIEADVRKVMNTKLRKYAAWHEKIAAACKERDEKVPHNLPHVYSVKNNMQIAYDEVSKIIKFTNTTSHFTRDARAYFMIAIDALATIIQRVAVSNAGNAAPTQLDYFKAMKNMRLPATLAIA